MKIVIGVTGASGAALAAETLRQLRAAGGQLRREVSELRLQMHVQLLDGVLQPVIGRYLLCLAHLHRLQVGQDDVDKKPRDSNVGIAHEKILRSNRN